MLEGDLNEATLLDDPWAAWKTDKARPISGPLLWVCGGLLALEAIVALWLRFTTTSLLWLDEALTVNIARQPLSHLHALLKEDGAPPLYYVLLHFWMGIAGNSDAGLRALSGIFSVLTVVVVFFVVRRIWGTEVGVAAAALLAASSFATYYATEVRMYSLEMLLVACGIAALMWLWERPSVGRAALVALAVALLEYNHYWSLYFLTALGIWMVIAAVAAKDHAARRAARYCVGALIAGAIAFLPWLPTFEFQSKHTGTPWAQPPAYITVLAALYHFTDNQAVQVPIASSHAVIIELLTLALVPIGIFTLGSSARYMQLDLLGTQRGRLLGWLVVGTMAIGIIGAHLSSSAYVDRYGAVVYVPLLILLAVSLRSFLVPWVRVVLAGLLIVAMLITGVQQRTTQRTQARQIVAVLHAEAKPGDLVVFCPDQLGPSVMRVLNEPSLRAIGYPRFNAPEIINWVDYKKALKATSPAAFDDRISASVGHHSVWMVWALGYGGYKHTCAQLAYTLLVRKGWGGHEWVSANANKYYQSMNLVQFNPPAMDTTAPGNP